ncbi:hypothetical protein DFP72DRAFT_939401 [Ephemerocybe angulata]|uniref:F-box domain-containing protein n=1 Tax=Ephemerocybe angulata TaxID=980116 RepID=A0A8H6LVE5_9AGAR|nr:hypothetical protein DFP72DRAFT_939401 [Tulosesus angulatus]
MDINPELSRTLWSNEVPTPIEATLIQGQVNTIMGRMSTLQAELQRLEEGLRLNRGALSFIRWLPPEILAEIFSDLVAGILDWEGREVVLGLGLVCKSWRRATLSSHRLWTSISVNRHQCNETSHAKIVTWLDRSGDLSKTVELDHSNLDWCECDLEPAEDTEEERGPCQMNNPTLTKLLSTGPKLHKLILRCSSQWCLRTLLEGIGPETSVTNRRPWDMLQALEVKLTMEDYCPWEEPLDASKSLFCYLPQVTSLELHIPDAWVAFEVNFTAARTVALNIPPRLLQGLKTFTLHCDWEGSHILEMLQHCQNVESLAIDFRGASLQHDENDTLTQQLAATRLLLPKIHTLYLNSAANVNILDFLHTPTLRDLHLDMEYNGYSIPGQPIAFREPLLRFIQASDCQETLISLHMQNLKTDPAELAHTFLNLPFLRKITLDCCRSQTDTFWQHMWRFARKDRESGDSPLCLPLLQELQTLHIPADGSVFRFVADFIRDSRARNCSPFSWKLSYAQATLPEEAMKQKVVKLERNGVSLQILPSQL